MCKRTARQNSRTGGGGSEKIRYKTPGLERVCLSNWRGSGSGLMTTAGWPRGRLGDIGRDLFLYAVLCHRQPMRQQRQNEQSAQAAADCCRAGDNDVAAEFSLGLRHRGVDRASG